MIVYRYLKGTFVSEEVKLALEKGYEIVNIDQVWHWPEDQRVTTLFKEFISRAYRDKVEASGESHNFLMVSQITILIFFQVGLLT